MSEKNEASLQRAILAGGCFWGVEYWLSKLPGVRRATSGYTGGDVENPTYEAVKLGTTGHYEAVLVEFDPSETDFGTICRRFLEIHDPGQSDGQGPDIGPQYRSAIFYTNAAQQAIAASLLAILRNRRYKVVTELLPAVHFWPAEAYHQRYSDRHAIEPECHVPVQRFDDTPRH